MTAPRVNQEWVALMEAAYKPGIAVFSEESFMVANDQDFKELELNDEYKAQHLTYVQNHRKAPSLKLPSLDGPFAPLEGNKVIRLLVVQPGNYGDALACSLRTGDFSFEYQYNEDGERRKTRFIVDLTTGDLLRYTALSYVWGPEVFTSMLRCNGHTLKITPTLEVALQYLRHSTDIVHLWIDQVCINQDDISEKQIQIRCMDMVYRRAYNTAIWLGVDSNSVAFEVLRAVRYFWQFNTQELTEEAFRRFEEVLLPISLSDAWQSLKKLFENDWFTRAWTIQECALSLAPYMVMGHSSISWDELASCCMTLDDSGFLPWLERQEKEPTVGISKAQFGLRSIILIGEVKASLDSGEPSEFTTSALVSTRYAQATNKRDKIYAILGMVKCPLKPNYSLDVGETYRDATALEITTILDQRQHELIAFQNLSIEEKRRRDRLYNEPAHARSKFNLMYHDILAILCCVDHPPDADTRPSWVPDWSQPRRTNALGYTTSSCSVYAAGSRAERPEITISNDGRILCLRSGVVDGISLVSESTSDPILSLEDGALPQSHFASLVKLAADCPSSSYGEQLFTAFCHTCVAGRDATGLSKYPAEYAEVFSLLIDEAAGKRHTLAGQLYTPRRQKGYFNLVNLRSRQPARVFQDLRVAYRSAMQNRRLCLTAQGRLGLVPAFAQTGDSICLVPTFSVPFVLRQTSTPDHYQLIGECYVHGIMDGEACDTADLRSVSII